MKNSIIILITFLAVSTPASAYQYNFNLTPIPKTDYTYINQVIERNNQLTQMMLTSAQNRYNAPITRLAPIVMPSMPLGSTLNPLNFRSTANTNLMLYMPSERLGSVNNPIYFKSQYNNKLNFYLPSQPLGSRLNPISITGF